MSTPSTTNDSQTRNFQFLTLQELASFPPKTWLVDNVIGPKDLGMIFGVPGSGKTFFAIDLITSVCAGQTWANRFSVSEPGNVLYCASEGQGGLSARFAAAFRAKGLAVNSEASRRLTVSYTIPQLYNSNAPTAIRSLVDEWNHHNSANLSLLVLDTFHGSITGADENSARDMGIVLASIRNVSQELGCAVLIVHHANKQGSEERGSSTLRAAADCIMKVAGVQGGKSYSLTCDKLKDRQAWEPHRFYIEPKDGAAYVHWSPSSIVQQNGRSTDTVGKCIEYLEKQGDWCAVKEIADAISMSQDATAKALDRATKTGKIVKSTRGDDSGKPVKHFKVRSEIHEA